MQRRVSIAEAKDQLARLVHEVEEGAPIEITRRGRPVAVLVAKGEYERLSLEAPSFLEALHAFRDEVELEKGWAEEAFEGVRDRSPGREVTP